MRTDSVNLSQEAINAAKNQILKEFGEEYSQPRNYVTKSASAQEAHEAIRPTDFGVKFIGDAQLNKLYQLIYKRTLSKIIFLQINICLFVLCKQKNSIK